MIVSIATLILGFVIGYLGQRSRLCFIAGYRDWFLTRNNTLLKGTLGAFFGALGGFILFQFLGGNVIAFPSLLNTASMNSTAAWLFAIVGGLGVGIVGLLSGGCPFRMHVLAAEGKKSNWYYLAGFYVGIVFFNLFTSPSMDAIALAAPRFGGASQLAPPQVSVQPAAVPSPTLSAAALSTASSESSQVAPSPTAGSTGAYLLSLIPQCEGAQVLDKGVTFAWPQVEQRLKELEGSYWGYYSCPQARAEVSAFYRDKMTRPPYNRTETNWVERSEGTLGVYYSEGAQLWIYMWIVPQTPEGSSAYVIVAMANGKAFEPTCG